MNNDTLLVIVFVVLIVLILAGRKRTRYVPKKSKDLAWAKFVQDFYRDPANRGKHPRRKDYELDHIYPHSKGGSNRANNIQVLSKKKNRKKGAKMPWEA
jgi:5-methylcytosine-specific restriction endonuclease McrA